jgi:hypothetical protein
MTRVRGTDKLDPPSTYQRIIERGPWASYARCEECGVDAGRACRDMNDREALEVCDERRLVINDSAARCRVRNVDDEKPEKSRRDKPPASDKRTKKRREEGKAGQPVYVACHHCGEPTRLWGQGLISGRTWCAATECRRHKGRVYRAERKGQKQQPQTVPCHWCGTALPVTGRHGAARPCCGDVACSSAIKYETARHRAAATP